MRQGYFMRIFGWVRRSWRVVSMLARKAWTTSAPIGYEEQPSLLWLSAGHHVLASWRVSYVPLDGVGNTDSTTPERLPSVPL